MKKSARINGLLEQGSENHSHAGAMDPCYSGFFKCFNEAHYFEAHDVLEHLWLPCRDENRLYYQGLIQIAGAFVHLKKHRLRPGHPKDAGRLRPAVRLFHLGVKNLQPYSPRHMRFDVGSLVRQCEKLASEIVASQFHTNPWHPERPPSLRLE